MLPPPRACACCGLTTTRACAQCGAAVCGAATGHECSLEKRLEAIAAETSAEKLEAELWAARDLNLRALVEACQARGRVLAPAEAAFLYPFYGPTKTRYDIPQTNPRVAAFRVLDQVAAVVAVGNYKRAERMLVECIREFDGRLGRLDMSVMLLSVLVALERWDEARKLAAELEPLVPASDVGMRNAFDQTRAIL